jgi:hypothetical protein
MRTVLMVVVLFAVSFLGVRWVTLGGPIPMLRVAPLKPDPSLPTFVEASRKAVAEQREQEWLESKTAQGDGDPERTKLRDAVIEAATAFRLSPCNEALKKKYIEAVLAYARAFVLLRGCPNFPICPDNDAALEHAKKVFRSPADARVREAMREVHDMGIRLKDYPGRLGLAIDFLSGSSARGDGEFSCAAVEAPAPRRTEEHRASDNPLPPPRRAEPGWNRKDIDRESRERYRKNVMEDLRSPGPKLCAGRDHELLVSRINQYYRTRDFELHGPVVRSRDDQKELEHEWSSGIDQQIDALVRDFYTQGYIRPNDLHKSQTVDQLLAGLKSTNRACASASKS